MSVLVSRRFLSLAWLYHSMLLLLLARLRRGSALPSAAGRGGTLGVRTNNERYQPIVLKTTKQHIASYIGATMNSVCTRCSLRLQRAAHTELRSTSTRAFSSAPVQRRGKSFQYNRKNCFILTLSRHPDLPRNLVRRTQHHPRLSSHQTLHPRLPGLAATALDLRHQEPETAQRQPSNSADWR